MLKPDPKIKAVPRPIRSIYLVEDAECSKEWLDQVFAEAFSRHGGRQTLIAPFESLKISAPYLQWMKFLDPDFINVVTASEFLDYEELSLEFPCSTIVNYHTSIDGNLRLRQEKNGLTSLSWIPFFKNVTGIGRNVPKYLLDAYPGWEDDGLITDNFGVLSESHNPFPLHHIVNMQPMILTPKDAPEDRWRYNLKDSIEISSGYDVLDNVSSENSLLTLGKLSNLYSQPYRIEHKWVEGFCVVVGDTFEDRVSCWNAGLLYSDSNSQYCKTLRIPSSAVNDEEKVASIGNFLKRINWISAVNSYPKIVVRSFSLDQDDLSAFIDALRISTHSDVRYERIYSLIECIPENIDNIPTAMFLGNVAQKKTEISLNEEVTSVPIPSLFHLDYCQGLNPIFTEGPWFIDLRIDRLNDNNRFINIRDKWQLPNRLDLARLFVEKFNARISKSGEISVVVNSGSTAIEVKNPGDETIFRQLICGEVYYNHEDIRCRKRIPPPYKYFDYSDKGRYLKGAIGLFGNLNELEQVINNHFWRSVFDELLAQNYSDLDSIKDKLIKKLKVQGNKLSVSTEAEWHNLSENVIKISNEVKTPKNKTSYQKLFDLWEAELNKGIEENQDLKLRKDEILESAIEDIDRSLSFLINKKIFYRGHDWVCKNCSHRNWASISSLDEKVECTVCKKEHLVPVNFAFDFRLNNFFASCYKEHDTISVAWALTALRSKSNNCFIFIPQLNLYKEYPEEQVGNDCELDVVCILDGDFVLGEVKRSTKLIKTSDIKALAKNSIELKANRVFLMALQDESNKMQKLVAELQVLLPTSIKAEGLVSDWDDTASTGLCY